MELAVHFRELLAQDLNAAGHEPFLWDFAGRGPAFRRPKISSAADSETAYAEL